MDDNNTKQILKQILADMDDFAAMKGIDYPPVYLLGGSGCLIAGYFDRSTTDIVLIDMEYEASMGRLLRILDKYDILDLYLTTVPEDFKERAVKISKYKNIHVLSKEDIIMSKIGRFSDTDIEDISLLIEDADKGTIDIYLSDTSYCVYLTEEFLRIFISAFFQSNIRRVKFKCPSTI